MPNKAEIKNTILTENTAQGVFKHLNDVNSNREGMQTRWIWELLQNARDASNGTDSLTAFIEYCESKIVFLHNGRGFKEREIGHLIFYGSTKVEDDDAMGKFGSGFLTTHLLSPVIDVSGQLKDGKWFEFRLERTPDSVEALGRSMDRAWADFKPSSFPLTEQMPEGFTTRFLYPIGSDARDAVDKGIATLRQYAPFAVVFNQEFSSINIKSSGKTRDFKVIKRTSLNKDGFQQVTVAESKNDNRTERKYLLAQGEKASIAVPLESKCDGSICLPLGNIPRLFLGFPLIGTEDFSFPAVINSLSFTPTEKRDGVYLWQSIDDKPNIENQEVIKEACELLIRLFQFVASSGWNNAHLFANVPAIRQQDWLKSNKLRETLREQLIEKIRQTPAVINEAGASIKPVEATLPLAKMDTGVEALWNLLDGIEEIRDTLPRRNEAIGWWRAVESWAGIYDGKPMSLFDEAMDGRRLAERIDRKTHTTEKYGTIKDLQGLLREKIDAVKWLDQLHDFFNKNELREIVREYHIVLAQDGVLDKLSNLHRDQGIAEELKDIAELLDWKIRRNLRDIRLLSLTEEVGKGDREDEYVVQELIRKLQERAENDPDDNFAEASVRLFARIVDHEDWNLLRDFPAYAEKADSDSRRTIIKLEYTEDEEERPLAPILSWPEDLQPYSELFPRRFIIAKAFFEAVPHLDAWQMLDEQGFLKRDVIITKDVYFKTFLPDEPLADEDEEEHETSEYITVTDIAFLTKKDIGIMDRVRKNQRLARTFWRFLMEWLIVQDSEGLEVKKARCDCEEEHRYYPAEWLVPVVKNKWVPVGNRKSDYVKAESLGSLLRGSGWKLDSLSEKPVAVELLKAIGVTKFDLMRELLTENDKERDEQDSILTDILVATEGDLSLIHEFVQDMKDDPKLPEHLEERRKRIRMVHENQHLGKRVEGLVRESLERVGFVVDRKPIGSDFEIEYDLVEEEEEMGIELSRLGQSWLVEVKATQGKEVRMTSTQARNAVKHGGGFLLCVVPIESGNSDPELDEIKKQMRFIKNIGPCISPLCNNLDTFEDLREDITSTESSGVQLEVVSGTARIRVANSVWENDGFPLENLADHLK